MPLRFLFDEHVSKPACHVLRERGVDVLHVLDVGLGRAPDSDVLAWAAAEGRIVVTRNYRDFATLIEAYTAHGWSFPGVLFLPVSLSQADVGAHVRAIEEWSAIQAAADPEGVDAGQSPIINSFAWLTAA
jgi:hypothetical protein